MEDKKTTNRRKLLIGLTGGIASASQLPGKWTKPVVDAVMLPAHAQTSATTAAPTTTAGPGTTTPAPAPPPPTTTAAPTTTMAPPTSFRGPVGTGLADSGFEKIISAFVSEAYAGTIPSSGDCCVNSPDGMSFDLKLLINEGQGFAGFYETSGTVGGGSSMVNDTNNCFTPFNIGVDSITASGATVNINGQSTTIGEGSGCPTNVPTECSEFSDSRLKTNIHRLNHIANGHQLYRFKYLADPDQVEYVGVMAQEILKTHPHAVTQQANGFYAVYYNQLGLKMTTLEQWRREGSAAVEVEPKIYQ